jgi:gluconolactonase
MLGAAAAALILPIADPVAAAARDAFQASDSVKSLPGGLAIADWSVAASTGRSIHGPVWLPAEQAIAFSDAGRSRRLMWSPDGGYRLLHENTNVALGTKLDAEGRFVQAEWVSGTITRIEADGTRTVLADSFDGLKLNCPLDLVIAPDGTIFFADLRLAFGKPKEGAQPKSGVYAITAKGVVTRVSDDIALPGGLALSPDGKFLYVSDRGERQLVRRYQVSGSALGKPHDFAVLRKPGWQAGPRGMTTDGEGNLYVGGPGGVFVFAPSGQQISTIPLATSRVAALTFGGDDMRTLFICSAVGVGYVKVSRRGSMPAPAVITKRASGPPLTMAQTIERHDPGLDAIIAPGTKLRNLASADFANDLGGGETEFYGRSLEGSFWHAERNCLLFSDIGNSRRMRWDERTGLGFEHAPTGYTNGANLDRDGLIVSCEQGPEHRLSKRLPDGRSITIADSYQGKRFNRPNDLAIHSSGDYYITDPQWDYGAPDKFELAKPHVYRISADGKRVELLVDDIIQPNGIAFSPDERILYIGDSRGSKIWAYDVAPDGAFDAKSKRLLCDLSGPRPGTPDGISVDSAGNLYAGGAGGLWIIDPKGKHLGTVVHGGTQTNNMSFGGPDRRTLYMVSWVALTSFPVLVPGPAPRRRQRSA